MPQSIVQHRTVFKELEYMTIPLNPESPDRISIYIIYSIQLHVKRKNSFLSTLVGTLCSHITQSSQSCMLQSEASNQDLNYVSCSIINHLIQNNILITSVYVDLMVIVYHYKKIGEVIFIIHHLATVLPFYFVLVSKITYDDK